MFSTSLKLNIYSIFYILTDGEQGLSYELIYVLVLYVNELF